MTESYNFTSVITRQFFSYFTTFQISHCYFRLNWQFQSLYLRVETYLRKECFRLIDYQYYTWQFVDRKRKIYVTSRRLACRNMPLIKRLIYRSTTPVTRSKCKQTAGNCLSSTNPSNFITAWILDENWLRVFNYSEKLVINYIFCKIAHIVTIFIEIRKASQINCLQIATYL